MVPEDSPATIRTQQSPFHPCVERQGANVDATCRQMQGTLFDAHLQMMYDSPFRQDPHELAIPPDIDLADRAGPDVIENDRAGQDDASSANVATVRAP